MSTLLLVDDDAALTAMLAEALQLRAASCPVTVHTADGWDSALRLAETLQSLDLLLVDYHLGVRTGIELYQRLLQRFPDLKALLYTGKASPEVETEAQRWGIEVLWKPQRLHALLDAVCKLLGAEAG